MTTETLPTWNAAEHLNNHGEGNALTNFIYDNEPAEIEAAAQWRTDLVGVLNYFKYKYKESYDDITESKNHKQGRNRVAVIPEINAPELLGEVSDTGIAEWPELGSDPHVCCGRKDDVSTAGGDAADACECCQ